MKTLQQREELTDQLWEMLYRSRNDCEERENIRVIEHNYIKIDKLKARKRMKIDVDRVFAQTLGKLKAEITIREDRKMDRKREQKQTWIIKALLAGIVGALLYACTGCEPSVESSSQAEGSSAGVMSYPRIETMQANVSGYCALECCTGKYADGITANGYRIQPGAYFVAADRRFAFGTLMSIPGYNNRNQVPVLDRGGKIKGNCIDLFFSDKDGVSGHQRALNWGRQYLTVTIERQE